jgi:hypothetical protein
VETGQGAEVEVGGVEQISEAVFDASGSMKTGINRAAPVPTSPLQFSTCRRMPPGYGSIEFRAFKGWFRFRAKSPLGHGSAY